MDQKMKTAFLRSEEGRGVSACHYLGKRQNKFPIISFGDMIDFVFFFFAGNLNRNLN